MNSIVDQLISQPDTTAASVGVPASKPIEAQLGEKIAPLGSGLNQTIAVYDRQQVIDWLSDRNFPALPVAPRQDAYKYHKVVKAQVLREVWSHCPLTDNHKPIPVYTGKNPSYLDSNGQPHLVNHRRYQKQLPSQGELKQWFANRANGVGTLGGWNDSVWLDFDVKNFASQQQCDRCVDSILAQPELQGTFVGRTHSGGWRVGVSVKPKQDFTNFALDEEGVHVGEALGAGRFTVLHGIGVSGNPYQILNCAALVEVESLRNIGIYPTKANKQQPQLDSLATRQKVPETSGSVSASIELEILGNPTSRAILGGDCPSGDRSGALATAVQEWYGWELWASENGILVSGSAETLAHIAGSKLGIDSDRVERILKTINSAECKPAALYRGGENSCWKKIYRLDKASYEANCPAHIRDALAFEWKLQNGGGSRGFGGNGGGGDSGSGSNGGSQQPDDPDLVGNTTVESHVFDRLFEGGTGKIRTLEDCFYLYSGRGYWKKVADKAILKAIGLKLKHAYKLAKRGKGIFQDFPFFTEAKKKSTFLLCRDTLDLGEIPANNHLRCFLNCAVDLRTGSPVPHQADHFLTTAIAAEYHANAPCPEVFRDFIASSFGSDSIEYVRALTSMLLDPTAPYGKFIHLLGPSGSGKGTLLRLWGEMFGTEHFRSGDFSNLSTAEGRHQHLTGCAIYSVPDVGGFVQGLKPFYELVDNGPMSGRALFSSHAYQKYWCVRYIIASVDQLLIENSGDGWDRRCLLLASTARAGIEDPHLGSKLAAVKGQIISWALAMDRQERDRYLLQPSTNEQILNLKHDAAVHGDPVKSFVDLCLRPTSEPNATLENHQLHSWFGAFCQQHGYQGWGMNKFINHLKTILPHHYVARRRAEASVDPQRRMIPAHWRGIAGLAGVFMNVAQTAHSSDYSQRYSSGQHLEPQWDCVKSKCCEGGLMAFQSNDGPDGSPPLVDGSVLDSTNGLSPDPNETTLLQEFQSSGSGRSPRSGLLGPISNEVEKFEPEKLDLENKQDVELGLMSLISPTPLLDLPDPKVESFTVEGLNADQDSKNTSLDPRKLVDLPDPSAPTTKDVGITTPAPVSEVKQAEAGDMAAAVVQTEELVVPLPTPSAQSIALTPKSDSKLGEDTSASKSSAESQTDISDAGITGTDEWLKPECIEDVALHLFACVENNDPEMLADLRQVFPNRVLVAAVKLLGIDAKAQVKQWVVAQNSLLPDAPQDQALAVGDRVWWSQCPGYCAWANPFQILSIDGDTAMIDLYANPVRLSELVRYKL